jgi:16S rRNA (uracil1498-N3)-methyltransferase
LSRKEFRRKLPEASSQRTPRPLDMIGILRRLEPNATPRIPQPMPSMDRFFCPDIANVRRVALDEAEAMHLTRVLRHQVGDVVEVFDGQGRSAAARLIEIGRRSATLELTTQVQIDPPSEVSLVLGVAPPKGDRLRWLIEKATELGVTAIVPLSCERSVVEPRETKLLKLEQAVIAACKQSRRNRLMEIVAPCTLERFFSQDVASIRLIADSAGRPLSECLADLSRSDATFRCAIGPEGGFTEGEREAARQVGAMAVSLGRNVLRVETAAVAIAAALLVSGCQSLGSRAATPTR